MSWLFLVSSTTNVATISNFFIPFSPYQALFCLTQSERAMIITHEIMNNVKEKMATLQLTITLTTLAQLTCRFNHFFVCVSANWCWFFLYRGHIYSECLFTIITNYLASSRWRLMKSFQRVLFGLKQIIWVCLASWLMRYEALKIESCTHVTSMF